MERKASKSRPPSKSKAPPPPAAAANKTRKSAPPPAAKAPAPAAAERNVAVVLDGLSAAVTGALPYDPLRRALYSPAELMTGFLPDQPGSSVDERIFAHVVAHGRDGGRRPELREALTQRLHDFSIDEALWDFLDYGPDGLARARKVVGVMGGHEVRRDSASYRKAAELGRLLARGGYCVVTGGGPGVMEAANLGAYLAGEPDAALEAAVETLAAAASWTREKPGAYLTASQAVLARHPQGRENLAIPTWFYGSEPTNVFATHIAKYFSNSIREEGLLAIAQYGVVFAPGSAATRQEIFLNAAQNHYGEFEWCSPMVFMGTAEYRMLAQVFPLVQETANENYRDLLFLSDGPAEIVEFIASHPPRRPKIRG